MTPRLVLEPVAVIHAEAMFQVLDDPAIYEYLDDLPPFSVESLREVYVRRETGRSPDGSELWLNWVVRPLVGPPIGYVQATIFEPGTAMVAYVLSSQHWGHGYARESVGAMIEHLAAFYDVARCVATVEAKNRRSVNLLECLAFRRATEWELKGHNLSSTERLFSWSRTQ